MVSSAPQVSDLLAGQEVVPVVVVENKEQALGLAAALLEGGVNVIEVTLRNRFAIDAIKAIKQAFPEMLVLAGTVNSAEKMREVISVNVDGVISPGITTTLLDIAREQSIPYLPGVATASEVMMAIEHGLTECKLFPATVVGGIGALKAFSGPFGEIKFCPTGGVTADNYKDFLALDNVMCVGGSWLAPSDLVKEHKWSEITALCKAVT